MNDKQIALFNSIKADMLSEVPEGKWSGRAAVPKIGETVIVWINDIGNSSVVGYWLEAGWIGLVVKPKTQDEPQQQDEPKQQKKTRKRKPSFAYVCELESGETITLNSTAEVEARGDVVKCNIEPAKKCCAA